MAGMYVNGATGNDGNPGTKTSPKATLAAAAAAAGIGDTIFIRGGQTYAEVTTTLPKPGQDFQPWRITGVIESNPVIDGAGITTSAIFEVDNVLPFQLTGASFAQASNTLTKAGAFSSYTWASGDIIYVSGGSGVQAGWYTVASKTDANSIVLATSIMKEGEVDPSDVIVAANCGNGIRGFSLINATDRAIIGRNGVDNFNVEDVTGLDSQFAMFDFDANAVGRVDYRRCSAIRPGRNIAGGDGFDQRGAVNFHGEWLYAEDANVNTSSDAFSSHGTGEMHLSNVVGVNCGDLLHFTSSGEHTVSNAFGVNCQERLVNVDAGSVVIDRLVGDYSYTEGILTKNSSNVTITNVIAVHRAGDNGSSQLCYATNTSTLTVFGFLFVSHSTSSSFRMIRNNGATMTTVNGISMLLGAGVHRYRTSGSTDTSDFICYWGGAETDLNWFDGTGNRNLADWKTNTSLDGNSFFADPKVAYIEGIYGSMGIARLLPGSPCIGVGYNAYGTMPADGMGRPTRKTGGWDLGPVQFAQSDFYGLRNLLMAPFYSIENGVLP